MTSHPAHEDKLGRSHLVRELVRDAADQRGIAPGDLDQPLRLRGSRPMSMAIASVELVCAGVRRRNGSSRGRYLL
jgi:hypothetical protein